MKKYLVVAALFAVATLLAACRVQIGDYTAASSVSRNGFARNASKLREIDGQEVRLWGYVDHSNIYGDESAQAILGDWWSGDGPDADSWRFNLKSGINDEAGESFAVVVPNDAGRDELLRAFAADAAAERPTLVYVTGRIFGESAPSNTSRRTVLRMELDSSEAILRNLPEGSQ